MKNNNYYGVYDRKESDTFRPTLDKRIHKDYPVSKTLTTRDDSCAVMVGGLPMKSNLRIRKLSPLECLKLMGFDENDYNHLAEQQSDSAIYHEAGDSLGVTLFALLVNEMLEDDRRQNVLNYIDTLKGNKNV